MKALNLFILLWALLLSGACTGNKMFNEKSLDECPQVATRQLVGTDSMIVLNLSLVKDTLDIPLSQLIEDFEIIKLDAKDEALTNPGSVCISDNYMPNDNNYVLTGKVKSTGGNLSLTVASPTVNKPLKKETVEVPTPQAGLSPEADSVWSIPHNTAYLKEWKTYFRTNNKYKDWDPDNGKVIAVTAVIEKDGSATDVRFAWAADLDTRKRTFANRINNSNGIQELEEEALRLIREAKIDPGKDKEGNPVRCKWIITVEFPPR